MSNMQGSIMRSGPMQQNSSMESPMPQAMPSSMPRIPGPSIGPPPPNMVPPSGPMPPHAIHPRSMPMYHSDYRLFLLNKRLQVSFYS